MILSKHNWTSLNVIRHHGDHRKALTIELAAVHIFGDEKYKQLAAYNIGVLLFHELIEEDRFEGVQVFKITQKGRDHLDNNFRPLRPFRVKRR